MRIHFAHREKNNLFQNYIVCSFFLWSIVSCGCVQCAMCAMCARSLFSDDVCVPPRRTHVCVRPCLLLLSRAKFITDWRCVFDCEYKQNRKILINSFFCILPIKYITQMQRPSDTTLNCGAECTFAGNTHTRQCLAYNT